MSAAAPSKLVVTSSQLRRQLSLLVARGYERATFSSAVIGRVGTPLVAVTFDDGERRVLDHGFPVLEELGLVGTVFVPVARVGTADHFSWDDLSFLAASGWEIGSHATTHARLTEVDDVRLDEELRSSRRVIEDRLGIECRSIAYPYGAVDTRVRNAAVRAGFSAGCVTAAGLRSRDPLLWPRVGVDGRDPHVVFVAKTSGAGRAVRASALGRGLTAAGRAARSLSRLQR